MAFECLSLDGRLAVPKHAKGLVVFAHGSGCSRFQSAQSFRSRNLERGRDSHITFQTSDQELCTRIKQRQNDASKAMVAVLHQQQ
jgi:hypothetical protein